MNVSVVIFCQILQDIVKYSRTERLFRYLSPNIIRADSNPTELQMLSDVAS